MSAPPDPEIKRVVIIEDHPMFRERLVHLIARERQMTVCGEADNVSDGLTLIERHKPDIAILDISLKGASGLELLKDLRARELNTPVLVLSMHEETLYAERALRAGARGYITKHEASVSIMTAVRKVLAGELYLNPLFMARFLGKMMASPTPEKSALECLSDRELEVFELIGRGQTPREIGARLHVGVNTIDTYRARIKQKLNLENGARLLSEAARWVQARE